MVGKAIAGQVYVHRAYAKEVAKALGLLDIFVIARFTMKVYYPEFEYTIIRFGRGKIAFTECTNFDWASEPTVGKIISFDLNTGRIQKILPPADPWVYHGKEEMVDKGYWGFSISKAKAWHKKWEAYLKKHNIPHSIIGKKSVWEKIVKQIK
jgi:hypothetical protein